MYAFFQQKTSKDLTFILEALKFFVFYKTKNIISNAINTPINIRKNGSNAK